MCDAPLTITLITAHKVVATAAPVNNVELAKAPNAKVKMCFIFITLVISICIMLLQQNSTPIQIRDKIFSLSIFFLLRKIFS